MSLLAITAPLTHPTHLPYPLALPTCIHPLKPLHISETIVHEVAPRVIGGCGWMAAHVSILVVGDVIETFSSFHGGRQVKPVTWVKYNVATYSYVGTT